MKPLLLLMRTGSAGLPGWRFRFLPHGRETTEGLFLRGSRWKPTRRRVLLSPPLPGSDCFVLRGGAAVKGGEKRVKVWLGNLGSNRCFLVFAGRLHWGLCHGFNDLVP